MRMRMIGERNGTEEENRSVRGEREEWEEGENRRGKEGGGGRR
jgi:hypothetical protein